MSCEHFVSYSKTLTFGVKTVLLLNISTRFPGRHGKEQIIALHLRSNTQARLCFIYTGKWLAHDAQHLLPRLQGANIVPQQQNRHERQRLLPPHDPARAQGNPASKRPEKLAPLELLRLEESVRVHLVCIRAKGFR